MQKNSRSEVLSLSLAGPVAIVRFFLVGTNNE